MEEKTQTAIENALTSAAELAKAYCDFMARQCASVNVTIDAQELCSYEDGMRALNHLSSAIEKMNRAMNAEGN